MITSKAWVGLESALLASRAQPWQGMPCRIGVEEPLHAGPTHDTTAHLLLCYQTIRSPGYGGSTVSLKSNSNCYAPRLPASHSSDQVRTLATPFRWQKSPSVSPACRSAL